MHPARIVLLVACTAFAASGLRAEILLVGEPVRFRSDLTIEFTQNQIRRSDPATRAGLVRWAATPHARRLLASLQGNHGEIVVIEDYDEEGMGRAPQPGLATLLAAGDPSHAKVYEIILNPSAMQVPGGLKPLPNQPATAADYMAIAWAAEMLHIQFYAKGIVLPHHQRADFQEAWLEIAAELGFPALEHGDYDEVELSSRRRVRVIGGRRR